MRRYITRFYCVVLEQYLARKNSSVLGFQGPTRRQKCLGENHQLMCLVGVPDGCTFTRQATLFLRRGRLNQKEKADTCFTQSSPMCHFLAKTSKYVVLSYALLSLSLLRMSPCSGGMLWFVDLTVSDSSLMLPVISTACTYTGLELAKMKGATGWVKVHDPIQSLASLVLQVNCYKCHTVSTQRASGATAPQANGAKYRNQ